MIEGFLIKAQSLGIVLEAVLPGQKGVEITKIQEMAVEILALAVLGDKLAVAQDDQLVAVLHAVAVELDEGHLGPIDPLFFHAREIFVGQLGQKRIGGDKAELSVVPNLGS